MKFLKLVLSAYNDRNESNSMVELYLT